MKKEEVKSILPHRDPFLFVDEITELKVGKFAKGIKYISPDLDFFKGHFPEQPVMPGVLILEALAQMGGIAFLSQEDQKGKIAYLVGVKNAKFRRMVVPGDTLILECELTGFRRGFGYGSGKAYVDGELVCEGTIGFAIR